MSGTENLILRLAVLSPDEAIPLRMSTGTPGQGQASKKAGFPQKKSPPPGAPPRSLKKTLRHLLQTGTSRRLTLAEILMIVFSIFSCYRQVERRFQACPVRHAGNKVKAAQLLGMNRTNASSERSTCPELQED